jgi:hypothetical protein
VNEFVFFYVPAIFNIVTDVALLILPIPYIWRLHVSRSQKILISGIFILGSL